MNKSYSILGTLLQVVQCSHDWLENAQLADYKFRSYRSPVCSYFPSLQLEKFPGPVQTLLLKQVNEAREWYNQGDPIYKRIRIPGWKNEASVDPPPADPELDYQLSIYQDLGNRGNSREHGESASIPSGRDILADLPRCECRWYRAWQLPCAHIWHHHLIFGSLLPAHLTQLAEIWATNGYEIYEEIQKPFQGELDEIIGIPVREGLDWRERMEVLNTKFYSVKEWLSERDLPSEAKKFGLRHFINEVFKRLEGIENFDMESWYQEHAGDWEV
jgi:hypothetical protein